MADSDQGTEISIDASTDQVTETEDLYLLNVRMLLLLFYLLPLHQNKKNF